MNKHKNASFEHTNTPDWADTLKETPAFEWLMENRKSVPYIFLIILSLIVIGYKLTSNRAAKAETNYLQAEYAFNLLQESIQNPSKSSEREGALVQLRSIVATYPELESKYDGVVAQLLLAQNQLNEALPFAERALNRTKQDQLEFYHEFSQITLLVSGAQQSEALRRSIALKEQMMQKAEKYPIGSEERDYGDLLYGFNLIRIGLLSQGLNETSNEINAWKEWNRLSNDKEKTNLLNPQSLQSINALFSEGSFTLEAFVQARLKALQK